MSQLRDLRVAVVGGAIGGATAALLLARAGARVTLLERVAEPRAVGAGILLQPNGLAVLYGLGLEEQLRRDGLVAREALIQDGRGRAIAKSPVFDFGQGLDHLIAIRRGHLFAALHDAVRDEPGIDARFGAEVTGATTAGEVSFADGGGTQTIEADLVIAADGVHSRLREAGDFGAREVRTGVQYVRGMSPVRAPTVAETWTELGLFGICPIGDETYFFSSIRAPALRQALERRDLGAFRRAWMEVFPASRAVLEPLRGWDDLLINEVVTVECRTFVDGRLALLGDAAHAMFPNLGQGANSAIVDALVLVHELREGPDLAAALRRYDARRRPAVGVVQKNAARLAGIAEARNPALRWLRDNALRVAGRLGSNERALRAVQQEDPAWLGETTRSLTAATATGTLAPS